MSSAMVSSARPDASSACPTETWLGLLADAHNPAAIEKVAALKGRPADMPIALLLPRAEAVSEVADSVTLVVADDGVGFDIDAVDDLGGLANMHDRAAAEAGSVTITSGPGGTSVAATIPLLEPAS